MKFQIHLLAGAAFALLTAGCGQSAKNAPPKDQVRDAVAAALPPFLELSGVDVEPLSTGAETAKVNFKATVAPKEDLFLVDHQAAGSPTVTLLKPVQSAGAKTTIYGFVQAQRTMDHWNLSIPSITDGFRQFGSPKGSFDARSYVAGSPDAEAALKQQAANAAEEERKQKALAEKQEQDKQAFQEQRQKEEQAAQQKVLQATAPGKRYVGVITNDQSNQRQRLQLAFTEQKGFLVRAEAQNPDKPSERQSFSGELASPPKAASNSFNHKAYSILLSPAGLQKGVGEQWQFYLMGGSLQLNVVEGGLEGDASIGRDYTIRLQTEQ